LSADLYELYALKEKFLITIASVCIEEGNFFPSTQKVERNFIKRTNQQFC
jgi:hypothetical protein